jgi:hypothetical protein
MQPCLLGEKILAEMSQRKQHETLNQETKTKEMKTKSKRERDDETRTDIYSKQGETRIAERAQSVNLKYWMYI